MRVLKHEAFEITVAEKKNNEIKMKGVGINGSLFSRTT
jgi:hypothetical protein